MHTATSSVWVVATKQRQYQSSTTIVSGLCPLRQVGGRDVNWVGSGRAGECVESWGDIFGGYVREDWFQKQQFLAQYYLWNLTSDLGHFPEVAYVWIDRRSRRLLSAAQESRLGSIITDGSGPHSCFSPACLWEHSHPNPRMPLLVMFPLLLHFTPSPPPPLPYLLWRI